jgi:hypothetical protein
MNVEEGGLDVILDNCCLHSKMQIQQCWNESIEWFGLLLRNKSLVEFAKFQWSMLFDYWIQVFYHNYTAQDYLNEFSLTRGFFLHVLMHNI